MHTYRLSSCEWGGEGEGKDHSSLQVCVNCREGEIKGLRENCFLLKKSMFIYFGDGLRRRVKKLYKHGGRMDVLRERHISNISQPPAGPC